MDEVDVSPYVPIINSRNQPTINPYSPPIATPDFLQPSPEYATPARDMPMVQSMSKWMRVVAGMQFVAAALLLVGSFAFGALLGGGALLLFVGGVWLHKAAVNFRESVTMNDATSLAFGFRNLRRYLILYGVVGLVSVLFHVMGLFGHAISAFTR